MNEKDWKRFQLIKKKFHYDLGKHAEIIDDTTFLISLIEKLYRLDQNESEEE